MQSGNCRREPRAYLLDLLQGGGANLTDDQPAPATPLDGGAVDHNDGTVDPTDPVVDPAPDAEAAPEA